MNVAIIDGYLGAGKTLGMTLLASYFQSLSNCALYSNYNLRNSKAFSNFSHFLDVCKETSSIICLDEAHSDLDARNFNTNAVKFFSHLIFYMRKIRATIFLATPGIDNLDVRVRSLCNLYIKVTKNKTHFEYTMYDMQSGRYLKRYRIKIEVAKEIASMLYDTYNMVTPMEFPEDRKEFKDFINTLKITSDEYYLAQRPGVLLPAANGRMVS